MIINRHNYEEFFILYWDNELDASQKKAVEDFVLANTDLQNEFSLFGNTRVTPDEHLVFDNKDLLERKDEQCIDHSNYEEYLLSYVDDELNPRERVDLEKFLHADASMKAELALLQSTKFYPELHIVFPDKSVLYRKEENPVLRMVWLRIAAAAIILIIAGFFTVQMINSNSQHGNSNIANQNNKASQVTVQEQKTTPERNNNSIAAVTPTKADQVTRKEPSEKTIVVNSEPDTKTSQLAVVDKQPEIAISDGLVNEQNVIHRSDEIPAIIKGDPNISFANNDVTHRKSPALDLLENDADELKGNGGLKGLLRKATRVFQKHTNIQATTDDNKLLVGAFSVSLK